MAFIPWKLLTGEPLPHNLAAVFFAVGGFIVSTLLILLIVRGAELKGSFITLMIGMIMLGMCNMVLPVLRLPLMYEVASLSAYFWSMLSLFFIFSFLLFDHRKIIHLLLASLCYGLAIASRFSYVYGVVNLSNPFMVLHRSSKCLHQEFLKKDDAISDFSWDASYPVHWTSFTLQLHAFWEFPRIRPEIPARHPQASRLSFFQHPKLLAQQLSTSPVGNSDQWIVSIFSCSTSEHSSKHSNTFLLSCLLD